MIGDRQLMTLHEVAVLLNVPNEYVERLLREGHLPVRGAGTEARVPIEDALAFKERRDRERRAGLRELSRLTQEFGAYDSE
jgi:excisionase family DNA binding protein